VKDQDTVLVQERHYKLKFIRCPNLLLQIIIVSLITLILYFLILPFNIQGLTYSISFFLAPALISTFIMPFMKGYKESINFRQSSFMSLITLGVVAILMLFYINFGTNIKVALIVSYAVTISFRYLIFRALFVPDSIKSIPYTFFNSVIALPFIHIILPLGQFEIVLFFLVSLISLTSIETFIAVIDRPFLSNFDTSAMDMIRASFQLFIGREKGKRELENIFDKNSIKADIEYTFFSFKNKNKIKSLFIIPNLHPGPLKGIAGSDLPEIISRDLKDYGEIFTFHGTSTHILNPIRKEDCSKISDSIKDDIGEVRYENSASNFCLEDGGVSVGSQMFGDGVFMTASYSPRPTEDIDAPIGKIIELKSEYIGYQNLGFVDAHNCVKKGCTEIYFPSNRYRILLDKVEKILENIGTKQKESVKMGIASKKNFKKSKGIAGEGIKVAVFDVANEKNSFILFDGNNLERGLREEIQDGISDLVSHSEVATTDSHEVNTLNKDYNPVGLEMDNKELIEDVRNLVEEAIDDLESVEVGYGEGKLQNFPVMGPVNSNKMTAVAETVYQIAPISIGMSFLVQALSTLLIILFL